MLLTVNDWERVTMRPVPEREGLAVVGVDLGAGRAWHSAVADLAERRVEAVGICRGASRYCHSRETGCSRKSGTYQKLIDQGRLIVAHGLRVQPPSMLADAIRGLWGKVAGVVADRFRANELADSLNGSIPLRRGCRNGRKAARIFGRFGSWQRMDLWPVPLNHVRLIEASL